MNKFAWFWLLILTVFSLKAQDIGYDPSKDPFLQLEESIAVARDQGKYVLVISGGDWCRWCHVLDNYLNENEAINNKLTETFVVMKVYWGEENSNEAFFSKLPRSNVAPHFWIINSDREVLLSQYAHVFEKGKKTYSDEIFIQFIDAIETFKSKKEVEDRQIALESG
jgi:hypothetical protein